MPPNKLCAVSTAKEQRGPNLFPTPECATRVLLAEVAFEGLVWEPANGMGHISSVLYEAGFAVTRTDLATGTDFLKTKRQFPNVITNPPYRLLDAFIERGVASATRICAMLVHVHALSGKRRFEVLTRHRPSLVLMFARGLPFWTPESRTWRNSGVHRHCWVIWDRAQRSGPTELRFVDHVGGFTLRDEALCREWERKQG